MKEFKSQKIKAVIKDLLKQKDITYEDLAEQMDCSIPTIKRILGPEELTLNRLLQLCEIVNVDLAELEALSNEGPPVEEKFTEAQEIFLSKNKPFMAYLMKLCSGESPKQIAEKKGLTPRSTDKYLIGLEKQNLIRVTGKQKVKPQFKNFPALGDGPLARVYFETFIQNGAQFFIELISDGLRSKIDKAEKPKTVFSIQSVRVTRDTYKAFADEQEKALRNFSKLASFEEKTKDPSELMTAVALQGNAIVKNDYKGLEPLDNTMGDIPNL